jgi:hypothetical protein
MRSIKPVFRTLRRGGFCLALPCAVAAELLEDA